MKLEQLEKGKKIAKEMNEHKYNIDTAKWTQSENVVDRKTTWQIEDYKNIDVPSSLFKIIGKLLLSEHKDKLAELEKEFESL